MRTDPMPNCLLGFALLLIELLLYLIQRLRGPFQLLPVDLYLSVAVLKFLLLNVESPPQDLHLGLALFAAPLGQLLHPLNLLGLVTLQSLKVSHNHPPELRHHLKKKNHKHTKKLLTY